MINIVMTFVLMSLLVVEPQAFAAKTDGPAEDEAILDPKPKETVDSDDPKFKTMEITKPKEEKENKEPEYVYLHNESLGPRIGLIFDPAELSNQKLPDYLLGLNYMFASKTGTHWDLSVDVNSNASGHMIFSRRWVFYRLERFRPHTKTGLALLLSPVDGLGSFLRFTNYNFYASVGFEDLISDPMSMKLELELIAGSEQMAALLVFGYVWGW
ncbi:MAG: hypothetical protein KDD25_04935 [Bdellovibrionales bacterium]|nr:hypothetical protein [Bdellovibrionales bacterium]